MYIIAKTSIKTSIKSSEREKSRLFSKNLYKVSKYYDLPIVSQVSTKWLQQTKIIRITV